MLKLLSLLAATFQAYQTAHHSVRGRAYFGDHEFLNDYEETHGSYDKAVERANFLDLKFEEAEIFRDGARMNSLKADMAPEKSLGILLNMEAAICAKCTELEKTSTCGTRNLVSSIADESEARQGHLKRRLKQAA